MAETFKAEAQRDRANLKHKTTPSQSTTESTQEEGEELKKFNDVSYEDEDSEEDEDDEYDDDDEDMEEDDELDEDDEMIMMQCPDYCKCVGQYAAAMTATYVSAFLIKLLYNVPWCGGR